MHEIDRIHSADGLLVVLDTGMPELQYGVVASLQFKNVACPHGRTPIDPLYTDASFGHESPALARAAGYALFEHLRALYSEDNADERF